MAAAPPTTGAVASGAATIPPPGEPRPRSSGLLGGFSQDLVDQGLLPERKAVSIALKARERGETFWRVLISESSITNIDEICGHAAAFIGTSLIETRPELLTQLVNVPWLSLKMSFERGVLLLKSDDPEIVRYAALDPWDIMCRDWIARNAGKPALPVVVLPSVFLECLGRLQREGLQAEERKAYSLSTETNWDATERLIQAGDLSGVPALLDSLLQHAIDNSASDLHMEPGEGRTVVRIRIDGILQELCTLPSTLHGAVVSRIKILSNMDVAERRRPQDGRITALIRKQPIDIRVSSFPTVLGEKIAMRLLDEDALRPSPEKLGLKENNLRLILDKISAPHGLIFVSGPTGAGKTTTLYSCLTALDRAHRNIVTIEDPVEYRLKGVHQMQVNDKIGLSFASGLRAILRQDPDVIMVGECRDAETAELAVQAALTGHVVFSTIHAGDAPGVISRLLDMDIEPFLVASALSVAISQRLIRKACRYCAVSISAVEMRQILASEGISPEKLERLGIVLEDRSTARHPTGCKRCRHTGYTGRMPVFEILDIDEKTRELIMSPNFSKDALRLHARQNGMTTMLENGIELVEDGQTTISEIVRVFGDGQ